MSVKRSVVTPKWLTSPSHRAWLYGQANNLFFFFERGGLDPLGGFPELSYEGRPHPAGARADVLPARILPLTARMVHCFAIGHLLGRPGSDRFVDHAMDFLWNGHRDAVHGGYYWGVGYGAVTDDTKQAYGHAFVLLAAAGAKVIGHPDADRLMTDISTLLIERFWDSLAGAMREDFTRDWQPLGGYRGQNSNMHLAEALMAAFEATNDGNYLDMAEQIADLIVRRHAGHHGWHLPEHFTSDWQVDKDYVGNRIFKPYGTTPGHSLEWARLVLQLWELKGRKSDWMPDAAKNLFRRAVEDGWDARTGGFYYTLDWDSTPHIRDRYCWPCCEGIGAAAYLNANFEDVSYEAWYRTIWDFTSTSFIDRVNGGWYPQVGGDLKPNTDPFYAKSDLYHALQACLIPLLPTTGSITRGLLRSGLEL